MEHPLASLFDLSSPTPRAPDLPQLERVKVFETGPYGPESDRPFSFFRDLFRDAEARHRKSDMARNNPDLDAALRGREPQEVIFKARPGDGSLDDARDRLTTAAMDALRDKRNAEREGRALDSTSAAAWVPAGVPNYVADAFAASARARATVADVLPQQPLPDSGLTVKVPRFSGGASVGVHNPEGSAVSSTDPTSALVSAAVSTIAGQLDMSQDVLDRSGNLDVAIATELGLALAERLDVQIVNGSGASGQMLGLLNVSGITLKTYTDASPTPAEFLAVLGDCAATVGTAFGELPDVVIVHGRRSAWVEQKNLFAPVPWPGRRVVCMSIPTTLGAGTNEDVAVVLRAAESILYLADVRLEAFPEVLSGTLQARFRARRYAALVAARQPTSIGKVIGTGMTAPVW